MNKSLGSLLVVASTLTAWRAPALTTNVVESINPDGSNNSAYSFSGSFSTSTIFSTAPGCVAPKSRFTQQTNPPSSFSVTVNLIPGATYVVEITYGDSTTAGNKESATVVVAPSATGVTSTTFPATTTAFQRTASGANGWTAVGNIVPDNTGNVVVTFAYSSAAIQTGRWYADGLRFSEVIAPPPPPGTPEYFDVNGSSAGIGGSGTWDANTTANWNDVASGTDTPTTYSQSGLAVFGGTAGTVSIASPGVTSDGGLEFDVDGYTINGSTLTLGTAPNVTVTNAAFNATVSAKISGVNGLGKYGPGTLTISGPNDFTGSVTIGAGTLKLGANEAFVSLNGSGNLDLGANTLTLGDATTGLSFDGVISDAGPGTPGSLLKVGSGTSVLNGVNTFNGTVTINGGTLSIGNGAAVGAGTSAININAATLQNAASTVGANFINTEARPIAIGAAGGSLSVSGLGAVLNYRNGAISGTGYILGKTGSGTLKLSDTSTPTHTLVTTRYLVVSAGLWQCAIDTALGEVPASPLANTITLTGGGGISANGPFEINSNRLITLSGSATFDTPSAMTYHGVISGAANPIHKTGADTLILGGHNTFSGNFQLEQGALAVATDDALGSATMDFHSPAILPITIRSADSSTRTINNPITLGVSTVFGTPGSGTLVFNGDMNVGNNAKVFTVSNSVTVINGSITNGNTSNPNTKDGQGTLVLNNANTYNKPTIITNGTLKVNNTTGSGTGPANVTVRANGTLGGTGTIAGGVTVEGTIAPGNGVGTLTTGSQSWSGGGHYTFEINDVTGTAGANPGWDQLSVNGNLSIGASSGNPFVIDLVSLSGGVPGPAAHFSNTSTYQWRIAQTTGGVSNFDPQAFVFNTAGFANNLGNGSFTVSVNGNDLVLNFVLTNPVLTSVAPGQANFSGQPNTSYTVQYAESLDQPVNWQFLATVTTDGSGAGSFSDPSPSSSHTQRFYRVVFP